MREQRSVGQVGAVIWRDGSIVLRRTGLGRWVFPRGSIGPDESPIEAARRVAEKRTGLEVEPIGDLGRVSLRRRGKALSARIFAFRATGRAPRWSAHEAIDAFLVTPDLVGAYLHSRRLRRFWRERGRASGPDGSRRGPGPSPTDRGDDDLPLGC